MNSLTPQLRRLRPDFQLNFHLSFIANPTISPCRSISTSNRTPSTSSLNPNPNPNPNPTSSANSTSSIHQSEINHFSKLSSKWWDPHGEFGLLHSMNPIRIKFIRDKILECRNWEKAHHQVTQSKTNPQKRKSVFDELEEEDEMRFLEGVKVLDVGCGGGLLTESLARLGASITGLDASEANINIAKLHSNKDPFLKSISNENPETELILDHGYVENSLHYKHSTVEDLVKEQEKLGTTNEGSFDVICSMEVLEHVNGPDEFLRGLEKLLKPGGHLFLSTISRTFFSKLLTIKVAEDFLKLVEPGTHTYDQYIKPSELLNFFTNDLGWYSEYSSSGNPSISPSSKPFPSVQIHNKERDLVPKELKFEIRGSAYNPLKNQWVLFDSCKDQNGEDWSTLCNYFFWIRKPVG